MPEGRGSTGPNLPIGHPQHNKVHADRTEGRASTRSEPRMFTIYVCPRCGVESFNKVCHRTTCEMWRVRCDPVEVVESDLDERDEARCRLSPLTCPGCPPGTCAVRDAFAESLGYEGKVIGYDEAGNAIYRDAPWQPDERTVRAVVKVLRSDEADNFMCRREGRGDLARQCADFVAKHFNPKETDDE